MAQNMKLSKKELRKALMIYAVTDRHWTGEKSLYQQTEEALQAGVSFVQIREKDLNEADFEREARQLQSLCSKYKVPLLVNDSVEIAMRINADGVHVGQSDMNAKDVRALIGSDKILGVSAQTVEEALLAEKQGADYLGVGAVFPTGSKDDAIEVSKQTLNAICKAVSIPVVAIGGISKANVSQLKATGISGVAVISAIYAQNDIKSATQSLISEVKKII